MKEKIYNKSSSGKSDSKAADCRVFPLTVSSCLAVTLTLLFLLLYSEGGGILGSVKSEGEFLYSGVSMMYFMFEGLVLAGAIISAISFLYFWVRLSKDNINKQISKTTPKNRKI